MVWGVREVMAGNHLVGKKTCRDKKTTIGNFIGLRNPAASNTLTKEINT